MSSSFVGSLKLLSDTGFGLILENFTKGIYRLPCNGGILALSTYAVARILTVASYLQRTHSTWVSISMSPQPTNISCCLLSYSYLTILARSVVCLRILMVYFFIVNTCDERTTKGSDRIY